MDVSISNAGGPIKLQAKAELSLKLNIDKRWDIEFDSRWGTFKWNEMPNFKALTLKLIWQNSYKKRFKHTKGF